MRMTDTMGSLESKDIWEVSLHDKGIIGGHVATVFRRLGGYYDLWFTPEMAGLSGILLLKGLRPRMRLCETTKYVGDDLWWYMGRLRKHELKKILGMLGFVLRTKKIAVCSDTPEWIKDIIT